MRVHLKSMTLKGFKSFPDRTRLEFAPGVSVIVGPNGSGKSNITDAVLWAMGEQSPLAVRGQSMQDVIFGGGRGVQARSSAEVELVLDNSDGTVDLPVGEISILRRLDRSGDGEYRLNGARCRMVDVLEVLSDTGLGKEIALGRLAGPRRGDRHLQAQGPAAADRGGRGPRQAPQAPPPRAAQARAHAGQPRPRAGRRARGALAPAPAQAPGRGRRAARAPGAPDRRGALGAGARDRPRAAHRDGRGRRDRSRRRAPRARRPRASCARSPPAASSPRRRWPSAPSSARRWRAASSGRARAADRIELRLERTRETAEQVAERAQSRERQLEALKLQAADDQPDENGLERIESIEAQLVELDENRAAALERELQALDEQRAAAAARVTELQAVVDGKRAALAEADQGLRGRPPGAPRRRGVGRGRAPRGREGRRRAGAGQPVPALALRARPGARAR